MKRIFTVILALVLLASFAAAASSSPFRPRDHVHQWVALDTILPTCTEPGMVYEQCSVCDESRQRRLPPMGHQYSKPWTTVVEPSCVEAGTEYNKCSRCGYEWYREIPALGHKPGEWYVVKEAANGLAGLKQQDCTRCGEVYAQAQYYEDDPSTYRLSLSAQIEEPKDFYAAGDTVRFICTLTNNADVAVDSDYARCRWYTHQDYVWMGPGEELYARLEPGQSLTYTQTITLEEGDIQGSDLYDDVSGVKAELLAFAECEEGSMTSNAVTFTLPVPLLSLYAYSTEWDESSAQIFCEVTNNAHDPVELTGHNYIGTDGAAAYLTSPKTRLNPGDTAAYTLTIPVQWDEEESDPEGELILLQAVSGTIYTGREVFSAFMPVPVGYEMGDMELVAEQKEVSTPANGAYYTEGETISYEVTLSNCQYYRLYGIQLLRVPAEGHAYVLEEADMLPGGGHLSWTVHHTVTAEDCENGVYEHDLFARWCSDNDDPSEEPNEIDAEPILSPCATADHPYIILSVSGEAQNGVSYAAGETVSFKLTVVNGSKAFAGGTLLAPCDSETDIPALEPGAQHSFHVNHTLTASEAEEGEWVFIALAQGILAEPDDPSNTWEVTLLSNPVTILTSGEEAEPSAAPAAWSDLSAVLAKYEVSVPANGSFYVEGETVYYNIVFQNDGVCDLENVAVFDMLSGKTPLGEYALVKPGETVTIPYEHTVTAQDVLKGCVSNVSYAEYSVQQRKSVVYSNTVVVPTGAITYPDYSQQLSFSAELKIVSTPANAVYYVQGETIHFDALLVNQSPFACEVTAAAAPLGAVSDTIDLGSYSVGAYSSIVVPFEHLVSNADAHAGKVTMSLTATATYDLPGGADFRSASATAVAPCTGESRPARPFRPGDLLPPALEEDEGEGIVLIQTLTKLPKNGQCFAPGESIEIDLSLINYTRMRFNDIRICDVLCDVPGHLVGSGPLSAYGSLTVHLSYTVTEDDLLFGKVYSDAWARLGLRGSNKRLMDVEAETLEIPVGEQPGRGLGQTFPGRRPIPGKPGSRRTLILLPQALLSTETAWKTLWVSVQDAQDPATCDAAREQGTMLWETAFDRMCWQLKQALGSDEAVQQALDDDRTLYTSYLDTYKERLLASDVHEAAVWESLTDQLRDQASELAAMLGTMDGTREDLVSLTAGETADSDDLTYLSYDPLNEYSYIKSVNAGKALRPYVLLSQRILNRENGTAAERWNCVAALWTMALDECYAKLSAASSGSLDSLLAAERAAFLAYASARGELYRLLYDDEAVSAELVARLIEEKAVTLSAKHWAAKE